MLSLAQVLAALDVIAAATTYGGNSFRVPASIDEIEHLGVQFFPEEETEFADNLDDDLRTDTIVATLHYHLSAGNAGSRQALRDAMDAEQTLRTAITTAASLRNVRPRCNGRVQRRILPGEAHILESVFRVTTHYRAVAA